MPPIAQLTGVSKLFGTFAALRQVSVSFEVGRCYVLLGENGAGKSTLLRVLAGLLRPSFGTVRVFDQEQPEDHRDRIGYMSHAPMMYDELSGVENLRYFASLYRERPCLTPEEALRAVGLDPELERTFGQYSQGMRQRASLARVLVAQPELLLLDEPFSNMDVTQRPPDADAAGQVPLRTTHHSADHPSARTGRAAGRLLPHAAGRTAGGARSRTLAGEPAEVGQA